MTDSGRDRQLDVVGDARRVRHDEEFRRIYDSEVSYVFGSLRRLGAQERELEDLAHDVFVVVHRRLEDYDSERPIRPWLFGIAVRVIARARRAPSRRETEDVHEDTMADPNPSADEQMLESERRELVLSA